MRGVVCFFLGEVSGKVERADAAVPAKRSPGKVLGELLSGEWLASLVKGLRERTCVDEVRVLDGDVQMPFVEPGFVSGEFFSSLNDYDGSLNVPRA